MKRKLCLFTDSLEPSGVGEQMLCFAAELRHDFQISFICPPTQTGLHLLRRARSLGAEALALRARGGREAGSRLRAWLRTRSVDIFHCHAGIAWEGHAGVRIARSSGVPLVLRTEHLPHVLDSPAVVSGYLKMLAAVDHVTCVSQSVHESFLSGGAPAAKLSVVRNGIKPHHSEPDRARLIYELALPADAY
ncbi:MAG: glycosyltransferase, partial [Rudaea sp.]